MSVDTNTKGKNLAPYKKLRHGDVKLLVSPKLNGMSRMVLTTKGFPFKRVRAQLERDEGSCTI